MRETKISRRYARALLHALREEDAVERGRECLQALAEAIESDEEIADFFKNPEVKDSLKAEALDAVLEGMGGDRAMSSFVSVLCGNGRARLLADIAREYATLADEEMNILQALVVSATELDEASAERIRGILQRRTGKTVQVRAEVDPALLGGVAVRLGNRVIDGSVRGRLESMRKQMHSQA